MPSLVIHNFSCIRHAAFELAPLTVVVGPQASGKSLLSKLLYFFSEAPKEQYGSAERGESIKPFLKSLAKKFSTAFPPNAWGDKSFTIKYQSGPITFEVSRKRAGKGLGNEVNITTSEYFMKHYASHFSAIQKLRRRSSDEDESYSYSYSPDVFDVRRGSVRALINSLGPEYVESQLFIPAGRSFFSNLGKAVAMFEFGSQLDDVTKRFGRRFTSLLDGGPRFFLPEKTPARTKEFLKNQKVTAEAILGGRIKLGSSDKHLETKDGRIIPFGLMSSGQQELLPLLLALEEYTGRNAMDKDPSVDLLYIEEPEAHLFPAAQSALVQHISTISNFLSPRSRFFITTHSPYVLSTFNNLVKANAVATFNERAADKVVRLLPRGSWIAPGALAAYALADGTLRSIKDDSGLIDGSYLDHISEEISSVFLRLLEIEIDSEAIND